MTLMINPDFLREVKKNKNNDIDYTSKNLYPHSGIKNSYGKYQADSSSRLWIKNINADNFENFCERCGRELPPKAVRHLTICSRCKSDLEKELQNKHMEKHSISQAMLMMTIKWRNSPKSLFGRGRIVSATDIAYQNNMQRRGLGNKFESELRKLVSPQDMNSFFALRRNKFTAWLRKKGLLEGIYELPLEEYEAIRSQYLLETTTDKPNDSLISQAIRVFGLHD